MAAPVVAPPAPPARADELKGDGLLVTPYPGSTLNVQDVKEYEEFEIPLGPRKAGKLTKSRVVAGRWTKLAFSVPSGRSDLEMAKNYEEGIRKAGFEIVFKCRKEACGEGSAPQPGLAYWPYDSSNYLAARASKGGEEIWIVLDARSNATLINVIRVKAMETGAVTVDAALLAKGILDDGHVAVYGIQFDTNKTELKSQSQPILAEIAALLKANAALKIYVVGHTDNAGTLEANLALSRGRAAAVVKELTSSRHGIAASRLSAQGVGPLVPVASNRSEAGRAKNRRVDLVEQ
jgi:outer membrane protein OmpA-like peptidoglycan-associated protein